MCRTDISHLIGNKRTLILGCIESNFVLDQECEDRIFIHTSLGGIFHNGENELEDQIKYYVSCVSCSQIIIVGHVPCHAMDYILHRRQQNARMEAMRNHLESLIKDCQMNLLNKNIHKRALSCEVVVSQAKLLSEFDFIRREIEQNNLTIKGVICAEGVVDTIFCKGLVLNTPILLT